MQLCARERGKYCMLLCGREGQIHAAVCARQILHAAVCVRERQILHAAVWERGKYCMLLCVCEANTACCCGRGKQILHAAVNRRYAQAGAELSEYSSKKADIVVAQLAYQFVSRSELAALLKYSMDVKQRPKEGSLYHREVAFCERTNSDNSEKPR